MRTRLHRLAGGLLLAATAGTATAAQTSDAESEALSLPDAPQETKPAATSPTRVTVEGAAGSSQRRFGLGDGSVRRLSIDLYHAGRLSPAWRLVVSNRLDHLRPAAGGDPDTLNSLREAYVGWDAEDGRSSIEFGRINLRQGPGYGYNPTDFFRDGSLRAVTSINPFAQRENRLGAVMLRAQRVWDGGSVTLVAAPKLANAPSNDGASLDLGATNNRNRWMLGATQQFSERVSAQAVLYKEPGRDVQVGASGTALLGNATVAHAEWSHGQGPSLATASIGRSAPLRSGHRYAVGLTHTTEGKLSITGEFQGNDFAWSKAGWSGTAAGGVAERGAYLLSAERLQDLASRQAALVYLTQKDVGGLRNLALSAFVRVNLSDHSRLHWAELRYQWPTVDLGVQWQLATGGTLSQFGLMPDRQTLQLVAAYHFR